VVVSYDDAVVFEEGSAPQKEESIRRFSVVLVKSMGIVGELLTRN
jgi:hypothetical protein